MRKSWPLKRRWAIHGKGSEREVQTSDLTDFAVTCLLGAAGLGKTHELSLLAVLEREKSGRVIDRSLGELASDAAGLRAEIEGLAGDAGADTVLMLDALDEAMVPVPLVGNVLSSWIGKFLGHKPKLRIACRSTVWPSFLVDKLSAVYGRDAVYVVELLPLDRDEIKIAAEAEEVDPEDFLRCIKEADAFSLAIRPLTLHLLIDEFRTIGKLEHASRIGLFYRAVRRLCQDPFDRHERHTARIKDVEACIRLAEDVAAIMLLCGFDSIDKTRSGTSRTGSIDLGVVESLGFDAEELNVLFETGLFTSHGPHGIRFIHRQIAEFLAGSRMSTMPFFQVRSALSRDGGHDSGVAGPLQEIAAWSACLNSEIADWISACDPELIGRSEVAIDRPRRTAFRAVVEMFRSGRLTEAQVHDDETLTSGFLYNGIEGDIRSILEQRGNGLTDVHSFAIKVTERNNLAGLDMDLERMALDSSLPISTRIHAAHAIAAIGDKETRFAIKPLISGVPEDVQDDLKGIALQLNWPVNMNDSELLSALTAPRAANYLGPYKYFLWMMAQGHVPLPGINRDVLRWASTVGRKGHLEDPLANIAGFISYKAVDLAGQEEICVELANRVIKASRLGASPFFLPCKNRELLSANDKETISSRFENDLEIRHIIIDRIVKSASSEIELFQAMRSVPSLFNSQDFEWLFQKAVIEDSPSAANFAMIAAWLPWNDKEQFFEMVYENRSLPVVGMHFPPLSIRLDSKEADRQRQYFSLLKEGEERRKPSISIKEEVARFLARCEENPHWFASLSKALSLEETGQEIFERFIAHTNGWIEADIQVRARIVEAAKRMISDCIDLVSCIEKEPLSSILMDGVMQAFFLLAEVDLAFLRSLSIERWKVWTWYIMRETRYRLNHEPLKPKKALMQLTYEFQPEIVLRRMRRLARDPLGSSTLSSIIEALEDVGNEGLNSTLCGLITDKAVRRENLTLVINDSLRRSPEAGIQQCLTRLCLRGPAGPDTPVVRAAVGLLKALPSQSFEQVFAVLDRRPLACRSTLSHLAHIPGMETDWLSLMSDQQQGHLLDLLFKAFPPKDDPQYEGANFVGPADSAIFLRDRLISALSSRGTSDGVDAIRRLEAKYIREYPWLRFPRSQAERNQRMRSWSPMDVREAAWVLRDSNARMLRSNDDLIVIVMDALRAFQNWLDGPPRLAFNLWNNPHGRRPTPREEESVTDNLVPFIATKAEDYSAVATRETQLRRRIVPSKFGGRPGQKTDVLVEVPSTKHGAPTLRVVIEVKCSHNNTCKTAMGDQLAYRYLSENCWTHGVFVVAYFDAPGMPSIYSPEWRSLEEAKSDLERQAKSIADESKGLCIRSFVLDATMA